MAKKVTDETINRKADLTKTESFIDQYKKPIIIGAGVIVVLILGIVAYQQMIAGPHEEESKDAYWNALYDFQNDSLDLAARGTMTYDGMEYVASEYEGTSGGDIANYSMGIISMEKGDFQGALDYFDNCDFSDIMIGSIVLGLKGDCYIEMGDYATAVEYFEKAAKREPNQFTSPLYFKKAGLTYEALDDQANAVIAYQKIKDEWPESSVAADIDKYIVRAQN